MQISNQDNKYKKKTNNFKIKKSQLCLFGSLLAIGGIYVLSYGHISKLKDEIFSKMELMSSLTDTTDVIIEDIPEVEELNVEEKKEEPKEKPKPIDYSKYVGVIEIPQIGLKRGFFNVGDRRNNIDKNVTVIKGSTMPDVSGGNLILAAHSGDAYISYFNYLYKLSISSDVYITYNGVKYRYQIVNIYNIPKNGDLKINRNQGKTTLTLLTCTNNSETEQTVYIAEMI